MLIFNSWYTGGNSKIYVAGDDGSGLRCLTSSYTLQHYQRLRLSPDRSRLLFLAVPPGEETGKFFVLELDAGRLMVDKQEPHPFNMRWLTGDRLLCSRKEKLWTADLATAETVLLDWADGYLVMDVAADADRLLLRKGKGLGSSVFVGSIARGEVREVVRLEEIGEDRDPSILCPISWSPDGRQVACLGGYEDQIWLVDADGSHPHKVADSDYFWQEFQWSPVGGRIACTRSLDGQGPGSELGGVFVKPLPDGEEKQVLVVKRGETWRWSPDGKSFVHAKKGEGAVSLWRTDTGSGAATELIGPDAGLKDIDELIVM